MTSSPEPLDDVRNRTLLVWRKRSAWPKHAEGLLKHLKHPEIAQPDMDTHRVEKSPAADS